MNPSPSLSSSESSQQPETSISTILRSNPEVEWITDAPPKIFLEVTAKAFSGSNGTSQEPMMGWALDGIEPKECSEERQQLYEWIMSTAFDTDVNKNSYLFGHPAPDDNGNVLSSSVLVEELDPSMSKNPFVSFVEDIKVFWIMVKDGVPPSLRSIPNFFTFLNRFVNAKIKLDAGHETYGPKGKHLYFNTIAMDPQYQGQGYGKQLLKQAEALSDILGLPCYLECAGQKNPAIYKKFGFRVTGETEMALQEDGSKFIMCHMVRDPKPVT